MTNSPLTHVNNPARSDRRPDNTYRVDEGLLIAEVPPPPEVLDSVGRIWWHYYCSLMVKSKILSQFFITSVTNLCMQHMIQAELWKSLETYGINIEKPIYSKEGYLLRTDVITNPQLDDYQRSVKTMNDLLVSLGMTAYSAKVNSIDTTGGASKANKATSPPPAPQLFKADAS